MFEERDGTLWIWLVSGKLFKFKDGIFDEIMAKGTPLSVVRVITQDQQGDVWLGTENDGACRFLKSK